MIWISIKTYKRGDIVLVEFPFSSGISKKKHPALIIQCDVNNIKLNNTIIVMISSQIEHADKEKSQMFIDINSPLGKATGLLDNSVVKCENIFTLEQKLIYKAIGKLSDDLMKKVEECICFSIGIK